MKKTYFALSMGLIQLESSNLNQNNIYSELLRKIVQGCIDSGFKVYLPFSVEHINTIDQVYDSICNGGYCVVALDKEEHCEDINKKALAIVRDYAENLVPSLGSFERVKYLDDFVQCFRPYSATLCLEDIKTTGKLLESVLNKLTRVVERGRGLSPDTKASVFEMLSKFKPAKAVG